MLTWKILVPMLILAYIANAYTYGQKAFDNTLHNTIYKKERELFYSVKQYNEEGKLIKLDTLVFSSSPQNLYAEYGQTRSTWRRKSEIMKEITGVTENDTVLWIHPPRLGEYRILELSPFPMMKYPLTVGRSWQWNLEVGGEWGHKDWVQWKGTKLFRSFYRTIKKETIKTKFGNLECYKVECEGKNEFAPTGLTFYFNQVYGFVRLDYQNINQSTMQFELIEETLLSLHLNRNHPGHDIKD